MAGRKQIGWSRFFGKKVAEKDVELPAPQTVPPKEKRELSAFFKNLAKKRVQALSEEQKVAEQREEAGARARLKFAEIDKFYADRKAKERGRKLDYDFSKIGEDVFEILEKGAAPTKEEKAKIAAVVERSEEALGKDRMIFSESPQEAEARRGKLTITTLTELGREAKMAEKPLPIYVDNVMRKRYSRVVVQAALEAEALKFFSDAYIKNRAKGLSIEEAYADGKASTFFPDKYKKELKRKGATKIDASLRAEADAIYGRIYTHAIKSGLPPEEAYWESRGMHYCPQEYQQAFHGTGLPRKLAYMVAEARRFYRPEFQAALKAGLELEDACLQARSKHYSPRELKYENDHIFSGDAFWRAAGEAINPNEFRKAMQSGKYKLKPAYYKVRVRRDFPPDIVSMIEQSKLKGRKAFYHALGSNEIRERSNEIRERHIKK